MMTTGVPAPTCQHSETRLAARLDGEPVLQSASSRTVKICQSGKDDFDAVHIQQRRSTLSPVAALNAPTSTSFEAIQHLLLPRNKTAVSTLEKCKSFDPGGKYAVKSGSFIRKSLNVRERLYCWGLPVWGYLAVE